MRKLKVDMMELEAAFDNTSYEMNYYLDTQTGAVISVTDEAAREAEEIYQEIQNQQGEQEVMSEGFAAAVRQRDIPEWRKDALLDADRVEAGYGTRYIAVPKPESGEGYRDMEAFIATVRDRRLQERLWRAISGRGAFRYFKDVLAEHPRERERWFAFSDARERERVLEWLESEGIEPEAT